MNTLTKFDWIQLKILVCNMLVKMAENSPEPNRTIRLTDEEVWAYAGSDSKRALDKLLHDRFNAHGGAHFTAKDRIFYMLSYLKAHRVLNDRRNGAFTFNMYDVDEELFPAVAELLDYCILSGVEQWGLRPDFSLKLKARYSGETIWLSREDLRYSISMSDLSKYRRDNSIYGTPENDDPFSGFDGLDTLDALAAQDSSDINSFTEFNAFNDFSEPAYNDANPRFFDSLKYQSQTAVVVAIKRCIEELGKSKCITLQEIAERMTLESAVGLQEHINDFSVQNELDTMVWMGIISYDFNRYVEVEDLDAFNDYADELVSCWLSSDLLVEGLMPDGSLNEGFFTMENVSSEAPILISPYDFEALAKAFVSHGNSLDGFCDEVFCLDEDAADF